MGLRVSLLLLLSFFATTTAYADIEYLPHVADGKFGALTYRTTFILFNNSSVSQQPLLKLTDDDGNPLHVTIPGFGTADRFTIPLVPGATVMLQTDGKGSAKAGAVTISSISTVGVSAIFTIYDSDGNYVTEAGVGSSSALTDFVLPVDSTGASQTGVALFSPLGDASLTMTLFNQDGSPAAAPEARSLKQGNHTAAFIAAPNQLFAGLSHFRGTLVVHSTMPVAAVALRQYQDSSHLCYTSLPVTPKPNPSPLVFLPQVVSGTYGNFQFQTSFLIVNTGTSQTTATLFLTKDDGSPFVTTIAGVTNSVFDFTVPSGGSVFVQTDGLGNGTSGGAFITGLGSIAASAIFTVLDSQGQFITEAGVGSSPPQSAVTLPIDMTGASDTGVALFNFASSPVDVGLALNDASWTHVAGKMQRLGPKAHLAAFVDELFPGTRDFRGSLTISGLGAVAVIGLRQNSSRPDRITYTSLPAFPPVAPFRPRVAPLPTKIEIGIGVTQNVTKNETLETGRTITGSVATLGTPLVVEAIGATGMGYYGLANQGVYTIFVPDGTYQIGILYQLSSSQPGSRVQITYFDAEPLQVSRDISKNITVPALATTSVTGNIAGMSPSPSGTSGTVLFTSTDPAKPVQAQFPLDPSGNFTALLPPGNYVVSASGSRVVTDSTPDVFTLYGIGSLAVGTAPMTANFSLPLTARLSGTIRASWIGNIPAGTNVTALDTSPFPIVPGISAAPPLSTSALPDPTGQFQLVLVQNRTYSVSIAVPAVSQGARLGRVQYSLPNNPITVGPSDTAVAVSLPDLPAQFTISGQVTDTSGAGVPNVGISVIGRSVGELSNLTFSATAVTDANGKYSVNVLSGRDYELIFQPPTQ